MPRSEEYYRLKGAGKCVNCRVYTTGFVRCENCRAKHHYYRDRSRAQGKTGTYMNTGYGESGSLKFGVKHKEWLKGQK